jgi:hypothetical protein
MDQAGHREEMVSSHHRSSIRAILERWLKRFPTHLDTFQGFWLKTPPHAKRPLLMEEPPFGPDDRAYVWMEDNVAAMAKALSLKFSPLGRLREQMPGEGLEDHESYLRRLPGQVMIRNTRANAGLKLPPRRAETVVFEPEEDERVFWRQWDGELRGQLARLNASQSNLWGRLLLQTAGSSPAAWRAALGKFPEASAARAWRDQAPLEKSWRRKCELIPPLACGEGGVVVFTQFLETQAALAEFLRGAGVATRVINGATPAPERQPVTEEFRKEGGALLLTHSGTEGRNLPFCHRLVNSDLPWNPMEIEQRTGRLHRLGQQHPVRIHNFVQAGTLQEHLLQVLQEKLNLFELVVGETGLVPGERFGSDEFAEEVFRRWRESDGRVAEAMAGLGEELAAARAAYGEVKQPDETLFAKDYESL